ncbi:RNA-binding protein [Salinarchaeum laminariae]|uniref:RNA-binding protein n=1 Tax=Salinarchaeum laminariae TaxID=869888 RepID=UPI0020BE11BF|nr:RNA-binding protein [Salinarchaeum laminariae]
MASVPFHYVDLRTFVYATEHEQRVEDALRLFLPEDAPIERQETTGHHGDRILVLSTRLEKADDVRHVLSTVAESDDFGTLESELDDRVTDNCELFVSLDKQAAFGGEARLGDGLTLRAKVEAYPAKREAAVENAAEALSQFESAE